MRGKTKPGMRRCVLQPRVSAKVNCGNQEELVQLNWARPVVKWPARVRKGRQTAATVRPERAQ